jgi:hypothetical protein
LKNFVPIPELKIEHNASEERSIPFYRLKIRPALFLLGLIALGPNVANRLHIFQTNDENE